MRYTFDIYNEVLKEGWYISSSCGCGDDSAIRLEYVETPDDCAAFSLSPEEAIKLGKTLIYTAEQYINGIEIQ